MNNFVLDDKEIRLVEFWISQDGIKGTFESILKQMDCTIETPIGRPMQTINARYKFLQVAADYVINKALDEGVITDNTEYNEWKNRLHELQKKNVAFEAERGTVVYTKKGKGKATVNKANDADGKRIATSIRTKDIITGEDVIIPIKKETAAERKLKAKAAKLSNFTFNIAKK